MLKKIDHLAFRFQLFLIMKLHSIIFITQLKSIIKKSNLYNRVVNSKSSSMKKKFNCAFHYEIKRLSNKKNHHEKNSIFNEVIEIRIKTQRLIFVKKFKKK